MRDTVTKGGAHGQRLIVTDSLLISPGVKEGNEQISDSITDGERDRRTSTEKQNNAADHEGMHKNHTDDAERGRKVGCKTRR